MAEVKLDISEYELMKENAKLLKKSLAREKELSKEVDRLNKEKIKALLDNEKSVTIVQKTKIHKNVVNKVSPDDISRHLKNKMFEALSVIVKEISSSPHPFRIGSFHHDSMDRFMGDMHRDRDILHRILRDKDNIFEYVMRKIDFNPSQLHGLFFYEPKEIKETLPDEIRTKGLDDVKREMKEKAFEELSEKAQKAYTLNPILEKERDDVLREINSLKSDLKTAEKSEKVSKELLDSKEKDLEKAIAKFSEIEASTLENIHKLSDINYVISNENGIFANKNKVIKIKQILENGSSK